MNNNIKEITKTGLYILATGGMLFGAGAVDSAQCDAIDVLAGSMTAVSCLLLAEKIELDSSEDVIQPVEMILEVPQRHAYNWAKQGRPGEIRL